MASRSTESLLTAIADGAKADQLRFQFLRNSGSNEMAVDGSVTPVPFEWSSNVNVRLCRLNAVVLQTTVQFDGFVGVNALANGLLLRILSAEGEVVLDFMDGAAIRRHIDWVWLAGVDVNRQAGGAGDETLAVRWTFTKAADAPIWIAGGNRVQLLVQDDLSGITSMAMMIQGRTV